MLLSIIIIIPLCAAVVTLFLKEKRSIEIVAVVAQSSALIASAKLVIDIFGGAVIFSSGKWLMADALSAYLAILVNFTSLMAILYSVGYLREELKKNIINLKQVRQYYVFIQLFIFAMLLALFSDNLALMWVAIEGTTLATAFLINFYNNQKTLEAAWKYLIICTVGISIALFGVVLTYYAAFTSGARVTDVLAWSSLVPVANLLNPKLLKIAFIFIFVGYGTKVGLAPMHTWLPDAHGRAPSPISALLSGVLLNVALYSILRFKVITDGSLGSPAFTNMFFVVFGAVSVVTASLIMLTAKKYKRLLAYSSIEHMGLITLGIGFGTPLSIIGSLWHMLNHAATKSMLFFAAGNTLLKYNTGSISKVRGMIKSLPATSILFIIAVVAIVGLPPFSPFFSKLLILSGGFSGANIWFSVAVLFALVLAFAAFFSNMNHMLFGEPPVGVKKGEAGYFTIIPLIINLAVIIIFSLFAPQSFMQLLEQIRQII